MHASCPPATATLVQSIPVGDFSVKAATGTIPTWLALVALANCSTTSLDFTAMYMDLLGTEDRQQFTPSEMTDFGADRGYAVFDAVRAAARRGVKIRILLGTLNDPLNSTEVQSLLQFPSVAARSWDPDPWYGGGIMHMKLWVSDGAAMYTGSANADWKSLAQVKEVGVTLADATVAGDAQKVYETFWQWADPARTPANVTAWSDDYQATLTLPPWDPAVPSAARAPSPFAAEATAYNQANPMPLPGGNGSAYLSASPGGALVPGRARDIDALVGTIRSASSSLSLSVMDFLPASDFSGGRGGSAVWWPALVDAVLAVVYAKPVRARLLVSHWAHTSDQQVSAMRRLATGLAACSGAWQACAGSLEVREFFVPGWNQTQTESCGGKKCPGKKWPAYSRVNHAKYIVSDGRLNVGTSNWQWGYFHNTAGLSFNTDGAALIGTAQAIFDADWASAYAVPLAT